LTNDPEGIIVRRSWLDLNQGKQSVAPAAVVCS
jgi:hypothetical protein